MPHRFKKIARVLVGEGKLSRYGACAEFYSGLPEKIQEDVQRRLSIDWTSTANLDVERIMQEVIDLENGKLERQRLAVYSSFTTQHHLNLNLSMIAYLLPSLYLFSIPVIKYFMSCI